MKLSCRSPWLLGLFLVALALLFASAPPLPAAYEGVVAAAAEGNRITLDFEGRGDREKLTNQYAHLGVSFAGATVLGQGASLNYLHFPPHSGTNVVYDDPEQSGRISIAFDPSVALVVTRVGAYVTGNRNVTMTAFGADDSELGSVSTGGPNYAPDGTPNKLLEISATQVIKTVVFFNGGERGNTYTVDDFYFETGLACNITGVPLYKQGGNAQWADDLYGGSVDSPWFDEHGHKGTIREWGCALTSAAMVVSYYGDLQGQAATTPRELNNWLREEANDGYTGGAIQWSKVAEFARDVKNIDLYHYAGWGPDNGIINAYLCNGAPMILNTTSSPYPSSGHFVVATGAAGTTAWNVNDPGGYDITTLNAQPPRSYRKYGAEETAPEYLTIAIHPPTGPSFVSEGANAAISILVTDPAGRVLSYDALTGEYVNGIVDAEFGVETLGADDGSGGYFETFTFATGSPLEGDYQVRITSFATGFYAIDLLAYDASDTSSSASTAGFALSGSEIALGVAYSPDPGNGLELTPPDWSVEPTLYLPSIIHMP